MSDLPGPGIKPVFPALAGRFLFSVPPGKSFLLFYKGRMPGGGIPPSVIPHGGWLANASYSRNFNRTKPCLGLAAIPEQEGKSCSTPERLPSPCFMLLRYMHACVPAQLLQSRPLFATLWTIAHRTPLSTGFSRQEYWSRLPYPPPEDLRNPRIKPASLMPPALAGGFFTTSATWEAPLKCEDLQILNS